MFSSFLLSSESNAIEAEFALPFHVDHIRVKFYHHLQNC